MKKTALHIDTKTTNTLVDIRTRDEANIVLNHDATIDPQDYEDQLLMNLSMFRLKWICNRCERVRLTVDKQELNTYPALAERLMRPCKTCHAVGYLRME